MSPGNSIKEQRRFILILITSGLLVAIVYLLLCLPSNPETETGPLIQQDDELIFDGGLTDDILSVGEDLLTIEYAYVEDNGEEQQLPHGPYGSIHVVIYGPEQPPEAPWSPELELYRTMLYGPHQTVGNLFEWLDNEVMTYTNYALYDWSLHQYEQVTLRFYESDPGPGREHDDLLTAPVNRNETEEQPKILDSDKMQVRIRTRNLGSD